LFHLRLAKKIVCAQPAHLVVHRLNNFVATKLLRPREAPPPITRASQHMVCECAPLVHRVGGHSAAHHHFDHLDLWIRIRRLSRGAGMGLLRRRRRQPDPHHSSHSSFTEDYLARACARVLSNERKEIASAKTSSNQLAFFGSGVQRLHRRWSRRRRQCTPRPSGPSLQVTRIRRAPTEKASSPGIARALAPCRPHHAA
jgi:hypothetical protein